VAYSVKTTGIPGAGTTEELGVAQLDAPDGMVVVSAFGNLAGRNPDYGLSFLGAPSILHSTSVPGGHQLILDDDHRPVGVVFFGMVGADVEVGIVCVGD
jgi:hypothetical protein